MSYIIAIVLTLSAILGLSQPASASLPTSQPASHVLSILKAPMAPESIRCEEDMPCWDCATMGNSQCGPIAHDVDAFQSMDAMGIVPAVDTELMLSYHSSSTTEPKVADLTKGQFAIPSANVENLWHVMQYETIASC